MLFSNTINKASLRDTITAAYRMDEDQCVNQLIESIGFSDNQRENIAEVTRKLVVGTRENLKKESKLNSFLHQYDLSSDEGIALMCLAEALLRIPDVETMDRLISDKMSHAEWRKHAKDRDSLFMNAATWSLLLTGKIFAPKLNEEDTFGATLKRLGGRMGGAVLRPIITQGMKMMGNHFVMGQTIDEALERAKKNEAQGYQYSYDMLGEAARTAADAEFYLKAYHTAITAIGAASQHKGPINGPGISIKLSALHPRYEFSKHERVLKELTPRLLGLAQAAKAQNIGLTIDAEESDRLDLSLDIIETVFSDPSLEGWEGFGLAVQAYQKRAPFVIDWLAGLSIRHQRRLMVRLVKGAYWDSEIKQSQVLGLEGYPVFTRKNSTDVSYIACAKKLIAQPDCFYPQFGTHNAYSVAAILQMMGDRRDFEFQCLHGMGEPLYDQLVGQYPGAPSCRIYAPVGSHKDLLGYLVRRLLENGANTSFIKDIANDDIPIEKLIMDPVARIAQLENKAHPSIPLPSAIYPDRKNSQGIDFSNRLTFATLQEKMTEAEQQVWQSSPVLDGKLMMVSAARPVTSPIDNETVVGSAYQATATEVTQAVDQAVKGQIAWGNVSIEERAACLERIANLFERNMPALMMLLSREGGKCLGDCASEVREAVDFCRYYAERVRHDLVPTILPGPTGEFNELSLHPRGVFICISPWNFPLAIFAGQVIAALACGNAVIAKPAEQTTLIAAFAVRLMHEGGVPANALQLLPGKGSVVGSAVIADPRTAGVMFTGSTETAKLIQQTLTNRPGPIVPFIAETGGQNVMIVDSSALPEQVVADVINSAFNSAGQRCSALRVLFVQEDVAEPILKMLKGAMAELRVGDPRLLSTDVGPVIDAESLKTLQEHAAKMNQEAKLVYKVAIDPQLKGNYFGPCAFELTDLSILKREVFGPILHVIRYAAKDLDKVLESIINTGYGLTMGIHSRINATVEYINKRMPVGNTYVNRNMIGAVVGVQPFGGEGLSGTGPKAGGPHYLPRLCVERAISINTTAAGGNTSLVTLDEEEI